MADSARQSYRFYFISLTAAGSLTAFLYWLHNPETAAGGEVYALALSLARHGTFANPFFRAGLTGPSAHMTPLWPLTIALLMRALGAGFVPALLILAVLANGINAALLPLVSREFLGSLRPGFVAAAAVIVLPVYQLCPEWDAMYSADLLMISALLIRSQAGNPWLLGAVPGILFLLNPVAGLILLVFLIASAARKSRTLVFTGAVTLAFTAILLPWTIRNYYQFRQFVPLRDDLGIALYTSNNPCARPTLEQNMSNGCHQTTHPINSLSENRLVATLGEVPYNQLRLRTAIAWITANPKPFWNLTGKRFLYFWFPQQHPAVCAISIFGFAGLAMLIKRKPHTGLIFLFSLIAGSALYYLVEAQDRYRLPVYWCMCLCAGYCAIEACPTPPTSSRAAIPSAPPEDHKPDE